MNELLSFASLVHFLDLETKVAIALQQFYVQEKIPYE